MTRENQILMAAEKLFSERSFDGVGIDAIGKEAGIVGSGVYRHFASKQEILASLMDQATDALLMHTPPPSGDPLDDLRQIVTLHVRFCLQRNRLADIFQREHHILDSEHQRHFTRRRHQYVERWVECLDVCYPGHSRSELLAVVRAMHALMSSDTTRRSDARPAARLEELLTSLTLASLEGLLADNF